ncbi:MAG: type VII toxin-antitoxin system MntA family adenylyltransferase antitoxin [Candidatus Caldatribacteriaceae bacterium]
MKAPWVPPSLPPSGRGHDKLRPLERSGYFTESSSPGIAMGLEGFFSRLLSQETGRFSVSGYRERALERFRSQIALCYNEIMSARKREIIEGIKHVLAQEKELLFAYIFGSFVGEESYQDIDVAVYLKDPQKVDVLRLELSLEEELEKIFHVPFDVRVINNAPLGFVYNVLTRKVLVLDRDIVCRAAFESRIFREYFDFQYLLAEYLKGVKNAPV